MKSVIDLNYAPPWEMAVVGNRWVIPNVGNRVESKEILTLKARVCPRLKNPRQFYTTDYTQ